MQPDADGSGLPTPQDPQTGLELPEGANLRLGAVGRAELAGDHALPSPQSVRQEDARLGGMRSGDVRREDGLAEDSMRSGDAFPEGGQPRGVDLPGETGSAGAGVGFDRQPAPPAQSAPEMTGVPGVDEAIARLADLADMPVAEHPAIFEHVHQRLADALDELDTRDSANAGHRSAPDQGR